MVRESFWLPTALTTQPPVAGRAKAVVARARSAASNLASVPGMLALARFEPQALADWLSEQGAAYLEERVASGDDRASAGRRVGEDRRLLFPGDAPAPGQFVYRLLDDGVAVGVLWIGEEQDAPPEHWWVWTIEIDEPFRGRGFGRAGIELAEEESRRHGATQLGLNVFGDNHVARSLYTSLGYEISRLQMHKAL